MTCKNLPHYCILWAHESIFLRLFWNMFSLQDVVSITPQKVLTYPSIQISNMSLSKIYHHTSETFYSHLLSISCLILKLVLEKDSRIFPIDLLLFKSISRLLIKARKYNIPCYITHTSKRKWIHAQLETEPHQSCILVILSFFSY